MKHNFGHRLAQVLMTVSVMAIIYGAFASGSALAVGLIGLLGAGVMWDDATRTQEERDRVRIRIISEPIA